MEKKWRFAIIILVLLSILSFLAAGITSFFLKSDIVSGNVAVIPINGRIMIEKTSSMFGSGIASSSKIIKFIQKADSNPNIKAILFEINSPGGSAVASDEISQAIKKTNKTTIALIREVGASGAYWVASACDVVIANRMSVTGSIGVISSYLEFSGLLDQYNITYQRLVSGELKDVGSPYKEMTKEEEELFIKNLDLIHNYFIEEVATNRNLSEDKVKEIATGMFYLGAQAKELGLVDIIGGREKAEALIKEMHNLTKVIFVEYKEKKTFLGMLSDVFSKQSFFVGEGIGSSLFNKNRAQDRLEILV